MKYRYPMLSPDELPHEVREAFWRYAANLRKRSWLRWRVERLSRPTRYYRGVLVAAGNVRANIHYYEGRGTTKPRWKAERTQHVVKRNLGPGRTQRG